MKTVIHLILFSILPMIVFGQFEKSFTNMEEYLVSNKIQETLESKSYHYCTQMVDSLLKITDSPDRGALEEGLLCSIKVKKQQQIKTLLSFAQQLNYYFSTSTAKELQSCCPLIYEEYATVFQKPKMEISNFELANQLAQMFVDDQVIRSMTYQPIIDRARELGFEVKENYNLDFFKVDSINAAKLDSILMVYPNLGRKEVGKFGMTAIIAIIQHSGRSKDYKNRMDQWSKNKDIDRHTYGMFIDRYNHQIKKPQIYGTQFSCEAYLEIEDLANINERRMQLGMISIERYTKYFGVIWKHYIEDCKKNSIRP